MKHLVKTGSKVVAAVLLSAFFAATASAQEAAAKETSLTGEVLDLSCYMKSGAKGPEHKSCAAGCLKNGNPVGLLASDGKVYLVVEDHKNADPYKELINHPAEQVKLTGTLQNRNGMPGIVLSKMELAK
jgi:hypothetical protein